MTKEEKNTSTTEPTFTNKAEGEEAVNSLFKTLDDAGMLVEPKEKPLLERVKRLENEVSLLKDLFARSLRVNNTDELLND